MIGNRKAWMDLLFSDEIEGKWSKRSASADPGGATMHGITIGCLSDWLGRTATEQDVRAVTEDKAREIAIAMFWNPVNADKLPDGIDIMAADFAFNSHWTRAGKELQKLVGVDPDGFVGDKTLAAIRAQKPMELLMRYADARLEFMEGLPNWSENSVGWPKRVRLMRTLAQSKVKTSPTLSEMASSTIVKGAAVGAAASGTAVVTAPAQDWGQLWDTIQRLLHNIPGLTSGLPEALQSAEPSMRGAFDAANATAAMPGLAGHITAAVTLGASLYTIWRRYRMYAKGLS